MIGMRTKAPKSNEGKMVNGKETLRLRSKGTATVQEVVSSHDPLDNELIFYNMLTLLGPHTEVCIGVLHHCVLFQTHVLIVCVLN